MQQQKKSGKPALKITFYHFEIFQFYPRTHDFPRFYYRIAPICEKRFRGNRSVSLYNRKALFELGAERSCNPLPLKIFVNEKQIEIPRRVDTPEPDYYTVLLRNKRILGKQIVTPDFQLFAVLRPYKKLITRIIFRIDRMHRFIKKFCKFPAIFVFITPDSHSCIVKNKSGFVNRF